MSFRHEKTKLLGRPYRGGYEGEGTGGGWGEWGGGDSAGQDPVFADSSVAVAAPAAPAPAPAAVVGDTADAFIGSPVSSLTGGNFVGPPADFGFAPGPVVVADAQSWAGGLVGPQQPELVPLEPVNIQSQGVANVRLDWSTTVNLPALFNNVTTFFAGLLGIGSGTAAGVVGGSRAIAGVINAPSSFSETMTETVTLPGSTAPAVVADGATGATGAAATFAGATESGMGDGVSGSPVLGFAGAIVNDAPQSTAGGSVGATPGLGGLLSAIAAPTSPRGRYGAPGAPASSPNTAAPLLALAAAASLFFMG